MRLYQIQVKLKYKLLGAQKIKINVDIKLDLLPWRVKKDVLKFRSVSNIVIAPAKTGKDKRSKIAVINTDQTNKGIRSNVIPIERMLIIVVIKLIAPKIDEAPAKCNEKIAISTEGP